MFSTSDTIAAIATPAGRGAIGIVRLAGPDALRIGAALVGRSSPLLPRHATLATLATETVRDQVVVTAFPQPNSYTGDDVVEISAHGSSVVLRAILEASCAAGARLAAPGEFTLRAFLNGKIDLAQAEAVADLIDAATPLQARTAFDQLNGTLTRAVGSLHEELFDLVAKLEASIDFPDEGYHFVEPGAASGAIGLLIGRIDGLLAASSRGQLVREGVQVAIVGPPNVGKSSLFNALIGSHRAIVTDIPGTTRDLVTEVVDFGGLRVTLVDTAGLVESADPVEREGVKRAIAAGSTADVVLRVFDGSVSADVEEVQQSIDGRTVIVSSKADKVAAWHHPAAVRVSATSGEGLEALIGRIRSAAGLGEALTDTPAISNVRHIRLLESAREALVRARRASDAGGGTLPEEFLLADLQVARGALEAVTGVRTADDVLVYVFQHFCVGK